MIYLSGVVRDHLPALVSPAGHMRVPDGQPWAADNGRFARPENYTDDGYLAFLARFTAHLERCLFAVAPDIVGDAATTLEMSAPMLPRIRAIGYPAALVAQDGLEDLSVPWDDFDALFVGGSTKWKLSEAAYGLAAEAKARGKWLHMGRVNSWARFSTAAAAGYDSADGTVLRFDPNRPVHTWEPRVAQNPSLWRTTR